MGFTHNIKGSDRMSDMEAQITNMGVDYQKYKDGKEEHRLIIVWTPIGESQDRRVQTDILGTSSILKLSGKKQTITVGSSEHFFELESLGDIIEAGKLGYKAAAWMGGLEKLKVSLPESSGNLQELIGLQATIHQMTFNEVLGRNAKEKERPFWMPMGILKMPAKKVSLEDQVYTFIADEKTENEVITWCGESKERSMKEVFKILSTLTDAGEVVFDGGTYLAQKRVNND